jgi:hypothetical protein
MSSTTPVVSIQDSRENRTPSAIQQTPPPLAEKKTVHLRSNSEILIDVLDGNISIREAIEPINQAMKNGELSYSDMRALYG